MTGMDVGVGARGGSRDALPVSEACRARAAAIYLDSRAAPASEMALMLEPPRTGASGTADGNACAETPTVGDDDADDEVDDVPRFVFALPDAGAGAAPLRSASFLLRNRKSAGGGCVGGSTASRARHSSIARSDAKLVRSATNRIACAPRR